MASCTVRIFFGICVRNFKVEGFFERYYQFDLVERTGAQVVHKRNAGGYLGLLYSQLLGDNLLYLFDDFFRVLVDCHREDPDSHWCIGNQ